LRAEGKEQCYVRLDWLVRCVVRRSQESEEIPKSRMQNTKCKMRNQGAELGRQ